MLRFLAPSLAILGATSALAGAGRDQLSLRASFTDLRTKCAEFVANPQMKPVTAKLHCSQQEFVWRAEDPGQASLKNFRQVGAQLDLKTESSPLEFQGVSIEDTAVGCPTFTKFRRVVPAIEVELSCQDFLNLNDLHSFCYSEVSRRIEQDPGIVEESPTQETLSFCPSR
jgi:hypothetical protein